jgi:hypothetical protein
MREHFGPFGYSGSPEYVLAACWPHVGGCDMRKPPDTADRKGFCVDGKVFSQ